MKKKVAGKQAGRKPGDSDLAILLLYVKDSKVIMSRGWNKELYSDRYLVLSRIRPSAH